MKGKSGSGRMGVVVKRDWKGLICMALLAAMALQERAFADSGDSFRLDGSGQVTLDSGHAAKEGISSLRFTLTVEAGPGNTVAFEFAESNASISQYQYNENNNTMDIYLAGTNALFAEGTESLNIGRVVLQGGGGSAMVGVEEDSLQYVYGSKVRTMENVSTPETVRLGGSVGTPPPSSSPQPGGAEENNGGGNGWQTPVESTRAPVESTQAPDTRETENRKPVGTAKPDGNPKPGSTPKPSPSSGPPIISGIEPVDLELPGDSEEGGEDIVALAPVVGLPDERDAEGGFWEDVKPVLIGFAIAAALAGAGAATVLHLIREPRRRR